MKAMNQMSAKSHRDRRRRRETPAAAPTGGNSKRKPSTRSLRQRSAIRCRSSARSDKAALLQPVAHGGPGLAATDDEGFDLLDRHGRSIGEIGGRSQSPCRRFPA